MDSFDFVYIPFCCFASNRRVTGTLICANKEHIQVLDLQPLLYDI